MGYGFDGSWMMVWSIVWIAAITLVVALTWRFASGRPDRGASALDILKRRLAAGEISEAEFLQARKHVD